MQHMKGFKLILWKYQEWTRSMEIYKSTKLVKKEMICLSINKCGISKLGKRKKNRNTFYFFV